ncbi:CAP domain-containing protein [Pseudovibrio sp. SPO723]|uniref:CAP domain-containing protein n=1 Tax=Nesiotobacter zosterae TaxID=392721 RepID=UPI0029C2A110|nr:CAP domain-containing protein [Pseudovibrio sp. SPO723]MDX5592634.1 CAP domain-containing protein [Pseudovibrio sp. SPO723]
MRQYDGVPRRSRTAALWLAAALSLAAVGGCSSISGLTGDAPEIYRVSVNDQEALQQTNAWRAKHGLAALKLDPHLKEVSQEMADHVASRDSLKTSRHTGGSLMRRTQTNGYLSAAGAENLGAGYASITAAMNGWKNSKDHNKNLLNPNVTHMGIARTNRKDGTYRNFWVMTLAAPVDELPQSMGPVPAPTAQTSTTLSF